jgi:two-component system sensor histidine kinase PilS (NtrC family)
MKVQLEAPSGFGHSMLESGIDQADKPQEFVRLWRGFMTARVTLGLMLVILQGTLYAFSPAKNATLLLICSAYFAAALAVRLRARARHLGKTFDTHWISTVGVDILAFSALQVVQGNSINYAPLLALPVLMTSVLGSMLLSLGTAAGVTLLLFAYATLISFQVPGNTPTNFLQAALAGSGFFAISFLASQIANRLVNVELRAKRSQLAARVQRQVNELVIESLTDGILVVDPRGTVRSANPSARQLLGAEGESERRSFDLTGQTEWHGLLELMQLSFSRQEPQQADITIQPAGQGPRRVQVRTQLTAAQGSGLESLCVMFLKDQREMEARLRTEKLASMGRMSAAVAHEIRNPLAAIAQANGLLDEDLSDPRQKQLTRMVGQNAKRLEKIVDDILNLSRVQQDENPTPASTLLLNAAVDLICNDWRDQTRTGQALTVARSSKGIEVSFEPEHLRRILINLLDNARRYATQQPGAIQVHLGTTLTGQGTLSVWSDGQPMDKSVERHLFEPFFSSESRSSGLGLYICRELCEGHGASVNYFRKWRTMRDDPVEGNEFQVTFRLNPVHNSLNVNSDSTTPTSWPQIQR